MRSPFRHRVRWVGRNRISYLKGYPIVYRDPTRHQQKPRRLKRPAPRSASRERAVIVRGSLIARLLLFGRGIRRALKLR